MKKLFLSFAIAFLFISMSSNAQSPIDKVFEKYAGQDGFTTVNISKEMFQKLQQMAAGSANDSSAKELKAIADQLTGLKVLSFSFDSTNVAKAVAVYNEFAGVFSAGTYKDLMTINEGREYVKFMTKQDASGKVTEMVMLAKDKHEVTVLSLTGNIDLANLSKLSKGMNIHGMENFQKMKQSHKK
jgi:hypothetical protein